MDIIEEALRSGDREAAAQALAAIADRRADLDDLERRAIDNARAAGLSWAAISTALGLGSRQAAEQRRLRLDNAWRARNVDAIRRRRGATRAADADAGPAIAALRRSAATLADAIAVHAPRTHESAAQLARATLRAALDGPPGALVDLVAHALADLDRIPRSAPSGLAPYTATTRSALDAARSASLVGPPSASPRVARSLDG